MSALISHVESSIRAKKLLRDGERILVAVSGGVDSMVLLHLLHELSAGHRWKLTVAHFNHQLRGAASNADVRTARQAARKLKLPFVAGHGKVREFARNNRLSVEMAARKLRHGFLAGAAVKLKIPTIALAHHADDQVELFLLRLLRGAGGEGLAGMKWSNPSPSVPTIRLVRPLLDVSKSALQSFADENKIAFSEDASNASLDFQRNRIRHELIPLLTRHYQPALVKGILRTMEVIGTEAEFVAKAAGEWLKSGSQAGFDHLPVAVQRRVLHQQLTGHKVAPDFELIERMRVNHGQWIAVGPDYQAVREQSGVVRWRRSESSEFSLERRELLLSAKQQEVTFGGVKIQWEIADDNGTKRAQKHRNTEFFDADKVGGPICLRCWQPGDRFQPIGMGSAKKLQDLFTNLKVPQAERRRRVVAATRQGELFWVEGLRMAEKFKLDDNTVRKLKWRWQRSSEAVLS